MFPFSFEWAWDIGHAIFFGGTWYAVSILGAGMTYVVLKAVYDTVNDSGEHHQGVDLIITCILLVLSAFQDYI